VDAEEVHSRLFRCCLDIMQRYLRQNICQLGAPGTRARDIPRSQIDKIPLPVQYACRYWVHHLLRSDTHPQDHPELVEFFKFRFLYWIEVLSIIRRLADGITMIRLLESKLQVSLPCLLGFTNY